MGKKLNIAILSVLIITGGSYYGFWLTQSKKLEQIIVNAISQFNEKSQNQSNLMHVKVSYDKIAKSGFPFDIKIKIHNTSMEIVKTTTSIEPNNTNYHPENNNSKDPAEQLTESKQAATITHVVIEELEVDSDILLKKFTLKNNKLIKLEDERREKSTLDFKPISTITFKKPVLSDPILWYSNIREKFEDIVMIQYENNGFKLFDEKGLIKSESKANNIVKLDNLSDKNKYGINLFINFNNKPDKKDVNPLDDKYNSTSQMIKFLGNSNLNIDINLSTDKKTTDNQKLAVQIKKFDWDLEHGALKMDGQFIINMFDFIPIGKINHEFINYKNLFDDLENIFKKNDTTGNSNTETSNEDVSWIKFARKIFPEIANEKSNNDENLKIIYSRELGKPTMFGSKTMEEVMSEYVKYLNTDKQSKDKNVTID